MSFERPHLPEAGRRPSGRPGLVLEYPAIQDRSGGQLHGLSHGRRGWRQGRVRRAKLYYLRGLRGKAARIQEKMRDTGAPAKKGK